MYLCAAIILCTICHTYKYGDLNVWLYSLSPVTLALFTFLWYFPLNPITNYVSFKTNWFGGNLLEDAV